MPLISLCVTVYNIESYIGQCLSSILEQDFDDFEVVLVDNGSEDGSVGICEDYAGRYPDKVRFIKLPQPTVIGRSGKVALNNAAGDYMQIIDGDDYVAPGYLKRVADIIRQKNPDLVMGSYECVVEPGGIAIHDARIEADRINNVSHHDAVQYLFGLANFHKTQWRFVVKSGLFELTEKNKEADLVGMYGDMVGVSIWLMGAKSLCFLDGPFYYYRCRATGNMSSTMRERSTGDFFKGLLVFQSWMVQVGKAEAGERTLDIAEMMADILMRLFMAGADLLQEDELISLGRIIDNHREVFNSLKRYNREDWNTLVDLVDQFGSLEGLIRYISYVNDSTLEMLREHEGKRIYIFPTGIYSGGIARLLKKEEYDAAGFFDNDITKQDRVFNGIKCHAPDDIASFSEDEKSNSVILISTIYKTLVPVLEKQITRMGFTNIKVV